MTASEHLAHVEHMAYELIDAMDDLAAVLDQVDLAVLTPKEHELLDDLLRSVYLDGSRILARDTHRRILRSLESNMLLDVVRE